MVVDDLQNLRLVQARYGLGLLVVVHQDHLLAAGPQQMVAGQGAHHPLLLIQNGIGPEAAFQHGVLHVVDIVVQVEAHQSLVLADAADGHGMVDEPHCPVGVIGGGDDAGVRLHGQQLRVHLRLTDDDAADADLQRTADHVRLVAADHDAARVGEHQVLPAGGQGDGDLTGDHVPHLAALVENFALQHGQQVVHRDLAHLRVADGGHVIVGHIPGGEHSEQGPVLIGHGDGGDLVLLHGPPGPADGGSGGQGGGRVVIQVPDLGTHVVQQLGGLEAEAIQHGLGLVTDLAQAGGLVLPLAKGVLQRRVGHGGDDGVRVRVPVSGDIDGVHEYSLSSGCGASNFWRVDSFIMRLRRRFVNSPQAGKPGAGRAKTASASGGGGGFAPVRDGVHRVSK